MTNIPQYRAKKIDSDEYLTGDLFAEKYLISISNMNKKIQDAIIHIEYDVLTKECIDDNCKTEHIALKNMLIKLMLNERFENIHEIDPSTLSIHFPDMLDSQGNKMFASLSDDGKGGDILEYKDGLRGKYIKTTAIYSDICKTFERYITIGIQQ